MSNPAGSDERKTQGGKGGSPDYGAAQIKVLEGLEAVRKRPAMYVGSTGVSGLHHLVYEVVDNSVDEALAGHCTKVHVQLHIDDSVTVTDNGRGIPTEMHKEGKPAAEIAYDMLLADDGSLQVTPIGRLLVRNVAMVFDAYLTDQRREGRRMFSKTV